MTSLTKLDAPIAPQKPHKVAFGKGVECEKKFFAYFVKTEDEKES